MKMVKCAETDRYCTTTVTTSGRGMYGCFYLPSEAKGLKGTVNPHELRLEEEGTLTCLSRWRDPTSAQIAQPLQPLRQAACETGLIG